MKLKYLLGAFLTLAMLSALPFPPGKNEQTSYEVANKKCFAVAPAASFSRFLTYTNGGGKTSQSRMGLAWFAYTNKNYDEAATLLDSLIKDFGKSPKNIFPAQEIPFAYLLLGFTQVAQNDLDKASESFKYVTVNYAQEFNRALYREALLMKGRISVAQNNAADAVSPLSVVVSNYLKGSDFEALAHEELAEAYRKTGAWEKAVSNFQIALSLTSNSYEAYLATLRLGLGYLDQKDTGNAKLYLGKLEVNFPSSDVRLTNLYVLADLSLKQLKKTDAKNYYKTLTKEFGEYPSTDKAHFYLAKTALEEGSTDEAIAEFTALTKSPYEKNPFQLDVITNLYGIYTVKNDIKKQTELIFVLVKNYPTLPFTQALLPQAMMMTYRAGDYDTSASFADMVVKQGQMDIEVRREAAIYQIVIYMYQKKDNDKALAAFETYFKTQPPANLERYSYLRDYIKLLKSQGKSDQLQKGYEELYAVAKLPGEKSSLAYELAMLYKDSNKVKAAGLLEECASVKPDGTNAIPAIQLAAKLYAGEGQNQKAELIAAKAGRNYPDKNFASGLFADIAGIYAQKGGKSDAVKIWQRLKLEFPSSSEASRADGEIAKLK